MYLIALLLFPLLSFSSVDSSHDKLAETTKWIRLLHYKKNLISGYTSEADGKDFFLHPQGKTEPLKELRRTIEIFSTATDVKDGDPVCKFPLRYKWLNSELGMKWKLDLSKCTTYVSFFSKLAARRASIIFSSYYLSNPNSAFGHTFLRLSRYDDKNETEMLDYGINFSAESVGTNPFMYAVNGLIGGHKGRFTSIPYYYKVREYSNAEFRDLWSYNLKMDLGQILQMVDHVWELGHTYFDYFYFKENCSYHLLSVIEVVMPEKVLTDTYSFFAIPADTIRLLRQEGLIEEGRKRESTYSKLIRMSEGMSRKDLDRAKAISKKPADTNNLVADLNDKEAAQVLDVSLEAFDYFNAAKILSDDLKTKEIKNNILFARAKNPIITADDGNNTNLDDSPAISHSPTRAELSQGYESHNGKFTRLEFRASHHDLLDPPKGSLKDAQLEIGKISFRYKELAYNKESLQFEKLTLISIKNLPGQNFWASPQAWELEVGARQIDQTVCVDCPGAFFMGSLGNSLELGKQKKFMIAVLLNADVSLHNAFEENFLLGTGPKSYIRYKFTDKFLSGIEASYLWNTTSGKNLFTNQDTRISWESRFHASESTSYVFKLATHETGSVWFNTAQLGIQLFY
jgi:hypothetical protein